MLDKSPGPAGVDVSRTISPRIHALVAHALDVLMTCSGAATTRRSPATGRLEGEQREDALMDLEVAAVEPGVVGDDELARGSMSSVLERLQHAVELLDDEVEPAERRGLQLEDSRVEELRGPRASRISRTCR